MPAAARKKKTRIVRRAKPSSRGAQPDWASMPDEELLDLRFCDLGIKLEGSKLEDRIALLHRQLERRHIRTRPHCWLSDEWFSPDDIPGIAVPFYLAHPRLARLERRMMHEVEGGTHRWCMQILRHEAGHCVDTAFRLHRRRKWQQVFGLASQAYPEQYRPRPYSKSYVQHLEAWYAQSHPSEDFAETFAVWLNPGSRWRQQYQGWPALKKLQLVDELMENIADEPPRVSSRQRVGTLPRMRKTLRTHYRERQTRYGIDEPELFDNDLRKLFSDDPKHRRCESGAAFLRRVRPELRRQVAHWSGEFQYTIDQVLQEMMTRCNRLKLRRHLSQRRSKQDATILLAVHTMKYLHDNHREMSL